MRFQLSAPDFSLRESLESGQAFRWRPSHGGYHGFIQGSTVKVRQDETVLTVETIDPHLQPEHLIRYFGLDLDLTAILSSIDVDAQIHDAIARHRGLRILRQEPWECLASFICSSFNNIKRIQLMIERLCQAYGVPVGFNGFSGCAFPTPGAIAAAPERHLRALGLGFRASYLKATAKMVANGQLAVESLRRCDYRATKTALLHCDGVGDKVADCVALFGFEKYEAFPVDVWMARAMRYYFRRQKMTPKRIEEFAHRHFGRYAGFAQQYLYQYVRLARTAHRVAPAAGRSPATP